MEVGINEICRACLTHQEGMLPLFDIYEHGLTLADILKSCINTEIFEGDGYPPCLCDNCTLILTQFYNFAATFEESNKQLSAVLSKDQKPKNENQEHLQYAYTNFLDDNSESSESDYKINHEQIQNYSAIAEQFQAEHKNYDTTNLTEALSCMKNGNVTQIKLEAVDVDLSPNEICDNYLELSQKSFKDSNDTGYECTSCDEIFLYQQDYLEHQKSVHNDNSIEDFKNLEESTEPIPPHILDPTLREVTKYECEECGEAYLYQTTFLSHMRIKHKAEDVISENYCTKKYTKIESKPKRWKRRTTKKSFGNESERPYACNQCPRRFRQSYLLDQHKETHSGKKKFVCDVCGKGFVRKTYLDDHMEGHSNVKKHICKFCGKAFQRRTVLRAHKRTHTHPNFYECDQCGRGFTSTSTLKTHKKLIHIKERKFQCVICLQLFPLKSTLAKHIRRHINKNRAEKDYPCNLCEMQYRDKSSLKRHIEIKHLGKGVTVTCPDCPKQYTSKANLVKHRRKHHSIS